MLTALPALSQEDTVKLPFDIAKRVALDLVELDELRATTLINTLIISKYKSADVLQEQTISDQEQQLQLIFKNLGITETQLKAEKDKKPGWFKRFLILIGAAGVGYVIGAALSP